MYTEQSRDRAKQTKAKVFEIEGRKALREGRTCLNKGEISVAIEMAS